MKVQAGQLLVASAAMDDPNFRRTLILLLDTGSEGALGVVVNRVGSLAVADVLPDWADVVAEPSMVFHGGPVEQESVLCLTRLRDGQVPGASWRPMSGTLGLVDLDAPDQAVDFTGQARVFAGYAGWGAGQLEAEFAEGAWHLVDARPEDLFTADPGGLWQRVLARQSGGLTMLQTLPEDPTWN